MVHAHTAEPKPAPSTPTIKARATLAEAQIHGDARQAQVGLLQALQAATSAPPSPELLAALLRPIARQAFALRWRSPSGWQGGPVTALAVSADGRWHVLAVGSGGMRLVDATSGVAFAQLRPELGEVTAAALSPDGRWLAAGGSNGRVALWSLHTDQAGHVVVPRLLRAWRAHDERIRALTFSPDGRLATGGADARVHLWDITRGGAAIQTLEEIGGRVLALAWASSGRWLAAGLEGAGVRLWPSSAVGVDPNGAVTLAADGRSAHALAFDRVGTTLAAGSEDGALRLWDLEAPRGADGTPRLLSLTGGHFARILAVAFGGDDLLITGTDDGAVRLFSLRRDVERLPLAANLGREGGRTLSLVFEPATRRLVAGTVEGGLRRWQLDSRNQPVAEPSAPGHTMRVAGVAIAPGGKVAASASLDGSVRLWDLSTGKERARLEHGAAGATAVAFDEAGQQLATGGDDGSVRLWSLARAERPEPIRVLRAAAVAAGNRSPVGDGEAPPPLGSVRVLAFTKDGQLLAAFGAGAAQIWQAADGRELRSLREQGRSVHWATGGQARWLAAASDESGVVLWDVQRGAEVQRWPAPWTGGVRPAALSLSDDGKRLAVAGDDGRIRLLEVGSESVQARVGEPGVRVQAVEFTDGGATLLAAGADGTLRVFDVAAARERVRFSDESGRVLSLAVSADGRSLVTGSMDGRLRWWDALPLASAVSSEQAPAHQEAVFAVALDGTARRVASGSADRTVRLRDLQREDGRFIDQGVIGAVALSPDGARVAAGTASGRIRLWDTQTGAELEALTPAGVVGVLNAGRSGAVWALRWTLQGHLLASATEDGSVWLWQLPVEAGQRTRLLHRMNAGAGRVHALAFGPRAEVLASAGDDGDVRLWDVKSGQLRSQWRVSAMRITGLAFDDSGQRLVTGGFDGVARVWDVAARAIVAELNDGGGRLWSLAISPDAQWLMVGADDGALRIWPFRAVTSGMAQPGGEHTPWRLPLGGGRVQAIDVSADGRTLAAGFANGEVRTLDLRLVKMLDPATAGQMLRALELKWQLAIDADGEVAPSVRPAPPAAVEAGSQPPLPYEDSLDALLRVSVKRAREP